MAEITQKITPFLWFEKNNAEEAMKYYISVFKNSKIDHIEYYPEHSDDPHLKNMQGKVLTGVFELEGQKFMAIDGGPGVWSFSGAISFYVECDGQEEVDYLWGKLSAVPEAEQCGWCQDKFGLTWQIIPRQLSEMLMDQDRQKAGRAMAAMMLMKKIDVIKLKEAFEGK